MALKNLSEHRLVPPHEILPKEKVDEVLAKYGIELLKLPTILKDDPIAKELKAERGDLIRVVRKSPTAGEAIYFRVVI
jgi:DNA-directed RNA polymerase subunit H